MNQQNQLIEFTQDLALLIGAGSDLDSALQVILNARQSNSQARGKWLNRDDRFGLVLSEVRGQIRQGRRLSTSLEAHPDLFDRFYVGMIRSGESSGRLAPALTKLSLQLEASKTLRSQVATALIYPAILTVVMTASIVIVLAVVLPKLMSLFVAQGSDLSVSGQVLLGLGQWFEDWGLKSFIVLLLTMVVLFVFRDVIGLKRRISALLMWLPGLRTLIEQIEFSRFTASLANLLDAGVVQADAVSIASTGLTSANHRRAMQQVVKQINEGRALSEAIATLPAFSSIYAHSIYSGEASGQLPRTLHTLAARQQQEFGQKAQRLVAILEPLMVVIFGAIIGFVALTVFSSLQSLSAFPT